MLGRLRARVPHYTPERVQLASQLEELFLELFPVVNPTIGTPLTNYESLKTICIQLEHILNNKLNGLCSFTSGLSDYIF